VWYHATRSYLHLTKLNPAGKCVVSRDPTTVLKWTLGKDLSKVLLFTREHINKRRRNTWTHMTTVLKWTLGKDLSKILKKKK
jgi:hypothetical protein